MAESPALNLVKGNASAILVSQGYRSEPRNCGGCLFFFDAPDPRLDRSWVGVCRLHEATLSHLPVDKLHGLCAFFKNRPAGIPAGAPADLKEVTRG